MIKKVLTKRSLDDSSSVEDDLAYWSGKEPEERVEAVDYLRRQYNGSTSRLQRTAQVIQLSQS